MIVTQLGPSLARWFLWDTRLDLTDPVNASVFHLVCMQAMEDGFSECMKYLYGLVSSRGVSACAWGGKDRDASCAGSLCPWQLLLYLKARTTQLSSASPLAPPAAFPIVLKENNLVYQKTC